MNDNLIAKLVARANRPNGCPSGTHLVEREPCDCGAVIVVPLILAEQLVHDLEEGCSCTPAGCEDWPAAREFIVAVRGQT